MGKPIKMDSLPLDPKTGYFIPGTYRIKGAIIEVSHDEPFEKDPMEKLLALLPHTVNGKTSDDGWPYGTTHDMACPGCQGTSFTASPRSETYWSS